MRRVALILAGGKSSRMGVEKATLQFGNQSFLGCIYEACQQVCDDVLVAVGTRDRDWAAGLDVPGRALAGDPGEGPLVAISRFLRDRAQLFVTSCDVPMLQPAVIEALFERAIGHRGAVPFVDGRLQATCAVYSGSLSADAAKLVEAGERRASALSALPGVVRVDEDELRRVDPDLRSFRGCNTPEEYVEMLKFAGLPVPVGTTAGVQVSAQS